MNEQQAVEVVAEGLDAEDFEGQVFAMRVCGHSARSISKRFGISVAEVREICVKLLPTFDRAARDEELCLEALRLNALTSAWFPRAMTSNEAAAAIYCKLSERRSSILGLDKMPMRVDDGALMIEPNREGTTDRIERALARLAEQGRLPPPAPVEVGQLDVPEVGLM